MYLSAQKSLGSDDPVENVTADVWIDGTERIVDEVDGGTLVDGSCKVHPLLLTSAQVRPLSNSTT